jgi:hypothetical protein
MPPSRKQASAGPVPGAHAGRAPAHNGFATAALALGLAGVTLITIVPAVVSGVLGLYRARRGAPGLARCLAGIALAAAWAAAAAFMLPHLIRAADPGCASYKGQALTAYNKVIADFGGHTPASLAPDLSRAITALDGAAGRSRDPGTSRDLSRLTAQLRTVLSDVQAGRVVPDSALGALNADATHTDSACGTLRV